MADTFEDKVARYSKHRIGEPSTTIDEFRGAVDKIVADINDARGVTGSATHGDAIHTFGRVFSHGTGQHVHLLADSVRPLPDPREIVMTKARALWQKAHETEEKPRRYYGSNWRAIAERFDTSDASHWLTQTDARFGEYFGGGPPWHWVDITLGHLVEEGLLSTTPTQQFYRLAK